MEPRENTESQRLPNLPTDPQEILWFTLTMSLCLFVAGFIFKYGF